MKTFRFFLTGILLLCCSAIYAYSFKVDGIYYNTSGTNASVTYLYYNSNNNSIAYSGDIVIPESVEYNGVTYSVTSIGNFAFYYCSGLTSLEIPNSVTSIGDAAIEHCHGLTSVKIPNSVTQISNWAFNDCTGLTTVEIGNSVTWIGNNAFSGCSSLTSVVIPNSVTSIGSSAFEDCSSLTSVEIPNSVTSIGSSAFEDCSSLTSVEIPNSVTSIGAYTFQYCSSLTSVVIPNSLTSIGRSAFLGCSNLTSVYIKDMAAWCKIGFADNESNPLHYAHNLYLNDEKVTELVIPESVTSIGDYAFYGCSSLTSVVIPNSVTSIGDWAFEGCYGLERIYLLIEEPLIDIYNAFFSEYESEFERVFIVPESAVETYRTAEGWSGIAKYITGSERMTKSIEVTASNSGSAVRTIIGDDLVDGVVDLAIKGTINSYDIIVLNQKMPLLQNLDLSEATIVACDYPYYNSYCTAENTLGAYMFYQKSSLREVVLPKNLVGGIGNYAFRYCSKLRSVTIPEGVTTIGESAFWGPVLTSIQLPKTLKKIGNDAFRKTPLKEIILPPSLESIGTQAFSETDLTEIRLPSSLKSIGGAAFGSCPLKKVYTYTILPLAISSGTFGNAANAELYLPETSSENYYFAAGWNSFLSHTTFNEPYEYFYLNGDKEVNDDTGFIEGDGENKPNADINAGGGLEVGGEEDETEGPKQPLGDVNVENDGNGNCGSMIGNSNLWVDNLNIKINVKGGRWYFFAFPFDIKLDKITLENGSRCVWRYYDGEERANGKTGWKDVNGNKLNAAQGYIFQSSADDVLVLNIEDVRFKKEDKYNELVAHMSDNLKDASWNFMGNPYLSYYDMNDMEYSAPVTVWDGSKYVAIRPGDDDYHFTPFEAFFVQKPEGESNVGFDGDAQMTQTQSKDKKAKQAATRKMMVMNARAKENPRKLVNLTLTAGEVTDGTRIVFNNAQSRAYESECDAAKFETQGVIQLFTIGDQQERYAINERPADNGIVMLGFTVPSAGEFSISASRMDTPVYLKDRETGALVDLSKGAYNFTAKAGTNVNRFEVLMEATVTGINQVGTTEGEDAKVYDLGGRRVKENGKGVYIINGEKTLVK